MWGLKLHIYVLCAKKPKFILQQDIARELLTWVQAQTRQYSSFSWIYHAWKVPSVGVRLDGGRITLEVYESGEAR